MSETQRANAWIVGRDTGTSSKTIWSVMQMVEPRDASTPADADDFGRCYRLLKLIPEWRPRLSLVAQKYPAWGPIVREWDRLTEMFERVIAGGPNAWDKKASSAMYDEMCKLNDEGLIADGWVRRGKNGWEKGQSSIVQLGNGVSFSIR